MPEYEIVKSGDFDGQAKFKAHIADMLANGWVLVGGAHPYRTYDEYLEFSQTLVKNFPCVQD